MEFLYILARKIFVNVFRNTFIMAVDAVVFIKGMFRKLLGEKPGKTRVLVVRIDRIGDFVLWLDAARGLREYYPENEYEITLLCNETVKDFATGSGYFDRVLTLDLERYREVLYHFGLIARLRMMRFETAVNPTYSRDYASDTLMRLCGANELIGSEGDISNIDAVQKAENDSRYTRIIPAAPGTMMELERNAEFIRGLGLAGFRAGLPQLKVGPTRDLGLPEVYYTLFPGTSWHGKKWPLSRFAEISRRIFAKTGWTGVICGDRTDAGFSGNLMKEAGVPMIDIAGRTTLYELASVIKGCRLLVSNDTSAVHIAAAVSTPSVCVLGGWHFGRFLPYGLQDVTDSPLPVSVYFSKECFNCTWGCVDSVPRGEPLPCIKDVTVDMVWNAVEEILEEGRSGK